MYQGASKVFPTFLQLSAACENPAKAAPDKGSRKPSSIRYLAGLT
jgi:hypothetical protein